MIILKLKAVIYRLNLKIRKLKDIMKVDSSLFTIKINKNIEFLLTSSYQGMLIIALIPIVTIGDKFYLHLIRTREWSCQERNDKFDHF